MRFPNLVIMSINNLRHKKLRTVLTVLGIVIGTASTVVMVSLRIGLDQMFMEQISSWGGLTTINAYSGSSYGDVVMAGGGGSSKSSNPTYITDDVIARSGRLPHAPGVSPVLKVDVVMRQGAYKAQYLSLMGVSRFFLEQISLGEGGLPEPGEMGMVVGNTVQQNFYNSKTGHGYWDTGEMPDMGLMNGPLFMIFDVDAYFQTRNDPVGSQEGGQTPMKLPKKYMLNAAGMVEGGPDDWDSHSYNVYTDIDGLRAQLRKVFKRGTIIPGRPTNKKGKPLNYLIYNRAQIFVGDVEYVQEVQRRITDMGFQISNQADWVESAKQQSSMIRTVLSGVGAVSLFVAAIGTINTMMTSIYERTREIGVMKVLGCDTGNTRNMFLIRSGFIGFMGGIAGILPGYSASVVINRFINLEEMSGLTGSLSRIPPWPFAAAVVFAIFAGMVTGFMPAMCAVKLDPLATIRDEQGRYADIGDCFSGHS